MPKPRTTDHRHRRPWPQAILPWLALVWLAAPALWACGSGAPQARLPEGEAEYLLRLNPPACLLDQPTLQFEVRVGSVWSRVVVEGPLPGGEESAAALAALFAADPMAIRVVRGDLSRRTRSYAGGHPAQVLRVESLPDLEDAGAVDAPPGLDEGEPPSDEDAVENGPPVEAEGVGEGTAPPP